MAKGGKSTRCEGLPKAFQTVHLNAAGIDVGSSQHWVAVPEGRDTQHVRSFGAFTEDLIALAKWLKFCDIETVAMESTGVYWVPLFELLEAQGFEVYLVDPHRLKSVPGRKTDVVDCQWIQQLHTFGLLSAAFRPEGLVCQLRAYLRQRSTLVDGASQQTLRMQKAMDQMNIKLHKVVRDTTGVTGQRIIRAILSGKRNPKKLAKLRDKRCKNDERTIARALQGNWKAEHLFALQQSVELYDFHQKQIAACDREIERILQEFGDKSEEEKPASKPPKKKRGNSFGFDGHGLLYRMTGVDLTAVDGFDEVTVMNIIGETGIDMSRWRSEKAFTSWLALCPGNKKSGGKRKSGKTKKSGNRAAHYFRMAAYGLNNSRSALGAFHRRIKARCGPKKAVTATAHKLAKIFYNMLRYGRAYVDMGQQFYNEQFKKRTIEALKRRAKQFGLKLVSEEDLQVKATV